MSVRAHLEYADANFDEYRYLDANQSGFAYFGLDNAVGADGTLSFQVSAYDDGNGGNSPCRTVATHVEMWGMGDEPTLES
jgi:hypothetical protein